jgi:hypothetical protein
MSQQLVHIVTTALEMCSRSDISVLFVFPLYLFPVCYLTRQFFAIWIDCVSPKLFVPVSEMVWPGGCLVTTVGRYNSCWRDRPCDCKFIVLGCAQFSPTTGLGIGAWWGHRGALSSRFFVFSVHQWFCHRHQYLACRVLGIVTYSVPIDSPKI